MTTIPFLDCRCKKCSRFLGRIYKAGIVQLAPCSSCKSVNVYKFVSDNIEDLADVSEQVIEKHISVKK